MASPNHPPATYRIRVTCDDCTGTNDHGCFNGGTGWVATALAAGDFTFDGQEYAIDEGGLAPADAAAFEDITTAQAVADAAGTTDTPGPWRLEVTSTAIAMVAPPSSNPTAGGRRPHPHHRPTTQENHHGQP